MTNITLLAQVVRKIPKESIRKIIRTAQTEKHCKSYDTWSQLISMVFCQFSECVSVRDISNGLKSATGNLNHLGISRAPCKSTIAYQDVHRDSNVFRDIFYMLFRHFLLVVLFLLSEYNLQQKLSPDFAAFLACLSNLLQRSTMVTTMSAICLLPYFFVLNR